jgi:tetratricopeptide (TPR) repeat protein
MGAPFGRGRSFKQMSIASELPYDVFVSYRRTDNKGGKISELVAAIESKFHECALPRLHFFFDTEEITGGDDWEHRILRGLRQSRLFLAMLTPNYPESEWCRREYEEYLRRAAVLQQPGEGVACLCLLRLDEWSTAADYAESQWLKQLHRHQRFDFHPWVREGKAALKRADVRDSLTELCAFIGDRLDRLRRAEASPGNVPRLQAHFVGRVEELRSLREAVALHKQGVIANVLGLGGLGKAALAVAYAHAYAWDYPGGRWFVDCAGSPSSEHCRSLPEALRAFAIKIGFSFSERAEQDDEIAVRELLLNLTKCGRALMILDNVESGSFISPDQLTRFQRNDSLHVLITSRLGERDLCGSYPDRAFVSIDTLPEVDALALLEVHQPNEEFKSSAERSSAIEIVRLLGGFTLAVETTALYLGTYATEVDCSALCESLRSGGLDASEAAAADERVRLAWHEKLLTTTLRLTWQRLDKASRFALFACAYLPAEHIALAWLQPLLWERFPYLGNPADVLPRTPWNALVHDLLSLRIWQRAPVSDDKANSETTPKVVRLHRLVQAVAKRLGEDECDGNAIRERLCEIIVERGRVIWADYVKPTTRWEVEPLRACADLWLGEERGAGAALASSICTPLTGLARWRDAEALLRKALPLAEQFLPSDHPNLVSLYANLGQTVMRDGRLTEAEALFRQALAISETYVLRDYNIIGTILGGLGVVLQAMHRWDEAEQICRRGLDIERHISGDHSSGVVAALQNLGSVLMHSGRPGEAEPLLREALQSAEITYGFESPIVARALNNFSMVLQDTDRFSEAEAHFRRALEIDKACYGSDHPTVATRLNNLSDLLRVRGRYGEAEQLIRQALTIDLKYLGQNHSDYARDLGNLGCLLMRMNRVGEAVPILRQALEITTSALGPDHPTTALRRENLAIGLTKSAPD